LFVTHSHLVAVPDQFQVRLDMVWIKVASSHSSLEQRLRLLSIILFCSVIVLFRGSQRLVQQQGDVVDVALKGVLATMPLRTLYRGSF